MAVTVAVAVEVEAVPVRVAVPVTVVMVMVVMMTVPVMMMTVLVVMVTMPVVVTMAVVMADHVAMAAMTTTAVVTATAVRTCIGSGRDQRRKADNGRRDESEECRTFEHSQRPLARCEPSVPLVGEPERQVQAIDFRYVFVHLTFIDRAAVWQDGGTHRIAIVRAPS
jgi:hypothetical protein